MTMKDFHLTKEGRIGDRMKKAETTVQDGCITIKIYDLNVAKRFHEKLIEQAYQNMNRRRFKETQEYLEAANEIKQKIEHLQKIKTTQKKENDNEKRRF